jgi:hypothetical protein
VNARRYKPGLLGENHQTALDLGRVGGQKSIRFGREVWIGDPGRMIELLRLLVFTFAGVFRSRGDILLENFLLRQQIEVSLRSRRRPRLRSRDRLFWLIVRGLRRDRLNYLLVGA